LQPNIRHRAGGIFLERATRLQHPSDLCSLFDN
jgi:hypothetical protein